MPKRGPNKLAPPTPPIRLPEDLLLAARASADPGRLAEVLTRSSTFPLLAKVVHQIVLDLLALDAAGSPGSPDAPSDDRQAVLARLEQLIEDALKEPIWRQTFATYFSGCAVSLVALQVEKQATQDQTTVATLDEAEYQRRFAETWQTTTLIGEAYEQSFWTFAETLARTLAKHLLGNEQALPDIDDLAQQIAEQVQRQQYLAETGEPSAPTSPTSPWQNARLPGAGALLEVDNSTLYHSFRMALARGAKVFSIPPDGTWPTADLTTRRQTIRAVAQLRPDPVETEPYLSGPQLTDWQTRMRDYVMSLDDLTADVLDVISAVWLRQVVHPDAMALLRADDFLRLRGLKPHKSGTGWRGGYKEESRLDIAHRIEALRNTWIRVLEMDVTEEIPGPRGPRRKRAKWAGESAAIVVSSRFGQALLGGGVDPYIWRVRPGDVFARFLFGPGRQTALLSVKALEYDPYRQRWEKRLTRYLAWQWRTRQRDATYLEPFTVQTLLLTIGEEIDARNPVRTKNRLEKALTTLQEDEVVAAWEYAPGWDEAIVGRKGWLPHWLDWKVVIEPLAGVVDHYAKIRVPVESPPRTLPAPPDLAEVLRQTRRAHGLTQLQAAEEIGIDNTQLSRIERGKPIAAKTRRKIEAWLATKGSNAS